MSRHTPAITASGEGLVVRLRVKPGGSRNAVLGRTALADETEAVALAVSAPPEGGRANKAVIALLAEAWDLPQRDLSIMTGGASRTKLLAVEPADEADRQRLADWFGRLPRV